MTLPEFFYNIRFPVRAILETPAVNLNEFLRVCGCPEPIIRQAGY